MALETSPGSIPDFSVSAFNLGCQGPDLFSHGRRSKPSAVAFAGMLHRGRYGRFCGNAARLIRESGAAGNPDVVSWFLGFVTHQETDRALHPYVVNRSSVSGGAGLPGVNPSLVHAFFERILDVMILNAIDGRQAREFDTDSPFDLSPSRRYPIVDVIARSLTETYPERELGDDVRERVENAFVDSVGFYRLTNPVVTDRGADPAGIEADALDALTASGVALLYPCDLDPSVDWLNAERRPWKNPADGASRTESALDLFARAVDRSRAIVRLAREAVCPVEGNAGAETDRAGECRRLAEAIGDSCLSIAGPDGKVSPVVACEPFDLVRALSNETAWRIRWLEGSGTGKRRDRLTPENGAGMIDR
jgi:hypothetical protein